MHLIVKGNKFEAACAAADRGIPFAFYRETDLDTSGLTHSSFRDRVVKWFCEAPDKAPFPAGTLLHYTETEPT